MKINLKTMLLALSITTLLSSLSMNAGILHDAVDTGYLAAVKKVVEYNNNIDIDETDEWRGTPLGLAIRKNNLEIATYLIEHGADTSKVDDCVRAPLHWATIENNLEIVTLLIEHGADINTAANCTRTPLIGATDCKNLKIVKYLVEHGADINRADMHRRTPLHWAAYQNHLEIIKYLVEHGGADITLKNKSHETAFDMTSNQEIKEYLAHIKNYFDNLIVVTEKDLVNGNPIDPITIPNYNTLNLLPLITKKKMQISIFKNERIKKEFHNTHFLYL